MSKRLIENSIRGDIEEARQAIARHNTVAKHYLNSADLGIEQAVSAGIDESLVDELRDEVRVLRGELEKLFRE